MHVNRLAKEADQRARQAQSDREQLAEQQKALDQQLITAELRRAEAEREAQVLERQLDALAHRLGQGSRTAGNPPPRQHPKSPRRPRGSA
ncbi:MAG: hypothetical protein U1F68_17385 [Gammaproteobacteria bacterium]